MARVVLSEPARADLESILRYLNQEAGVAAAEAYAARFAKLFDRLALHPESGSPQARHGRGRRMTVVHPYNLFSSYDAAADTVTIARVLHGRRRITRRMLKT